MCFIGALVKNLWQKSRSVGVEPAQRYTWGPETSSTPTDPVPSIEERLKSASLELLGLEADIQADVRERLEAREVNATPDQDDWIFSSFTDYVDRAWRRMLGERPIVCWSVGANGGTSIRELVESAETALRSDNSMARIHKGSLYYNVGLAFFFIRDLDRALQYLCESVTEDALSGRPDRAAMLGQGLSRQVLVDPVAGWLTSVCNPDYEKITGVRFDTNAFVDLVQWLATRPMDAIQVIISLNRLVTVQRPPDNEAVQHLRVMAIADLVLVLESNLRGWQRADLMLHNQLLQLIQCNPAMTQSFQSTQHQFNNQYQTDAARNSVAGVNWLIDHVLEQITNATMVSEAAGSACFLAVRMRNALLHNIEPGFTLYTDRAKLRRVCAVLLAVLGLAKHGSAGTLGGL